MIKKQKMMLKYSVLQPLTKVKYIYHYSNMLYHFKGYALGPIRHWIQITTPFYCLCKLKKLVIISKLWFPHLLSSTNYAYPWSYKVCVIQYI